ncbi:hypothetical protein N2152v2_001971 [Parachlorella kessleri]
MQPRPTVIRVKRKRNADAPDDLVVEVGTSKRQQTSLSSRLDGMSLGVQVQPQAAPEAPCRVPQRFTRLTTLSAVEVSSLNEEQLSRLLQVQQQQQQQGQAGHRQRQRHGQQPAPDQPAPQPSSGSPTSAPPAAGVASGQPPAAAPDPAGAAGVYQQVRQPRRGVSLFQATEAAPDPLAGFARVYEVVRREGTHEAAEQGGSGGRGAPLDGLARGRHRRRQGGGQPEVPSGAAAQPAAWRKYAEGTLMCNQLPVVRQVAAGAPAPAPTGGPWGAAGGAHYQQQQQQQDGSGVGGHSASGGMDGGQHAESAGEDSFPVAAAEEAGDAMDEDEYVYDLYAVAAAGEGGEGGAGERERWLELHTSGRAPVIQILDDDSWLVVETSDVEDSDADSDDSNAEGYFAHDYPGELAWAAAWGCRFLIIMGLNVCWLSPTLRASWVVVEASSQDEASDSSSADDDGYDPEGAVYGSRHGKRKDWWEESDGEGASSDDGLSGGHGLKAQPRTYW